MLVGGASRRMGRDKALVAVDGVPMARRVADAMVAAGVDERAVVLVGGDARWADALGLGWVADRRPGEGPLAGLATALLDAPRVALGEVLGGGPDVVVVVAACDQPWLTGHAIEDLLRAREAADVDVAVPSSEGRRQPFPSAWRASAAPAVDALVVAGARRADAALGVVDTVTVALDPGLVADVDRPGDLPPVP